MVKKYKLYPNARSLTAAEKKEFLDSMNAGREINECCINGGYGYPTLQNSRHFDSEFDKSITDIQNGQVEEALIRLSKGKLPVGVRTTRTQKRNKDGSVARDEEGNPILEISKQDEIPIAPNHQAIELWLKTHNSDVYGDKSNETESNGPEESPEEIREKMLRDYDKE
jgi:hypothetical protein